MTESYSDLILELINNGLNDWQIKKRLFLKTGIYISSNEINKIKKKSRKVSVVLSEELVREKFSLDFFHPNESNNGLSSVISMVLRDNIITEVERNFIRQKAVELGVNTKILKDIDKYVHDNNPYYDSIIDLIWGDGEVSKEEIEFLQEKCQENNFSTDLLNKRFWQYSINFYFKELTNYASFNNFYKALCYILTSSEKDFSWWTAEDFFKKINILEHKTFEDVMNTLNEYTEDLFTSIFPDLFTSSIVSSSENELEQSANDLEENEDRQEKSESKTTVNLSEEYKGVIEMYSLNPFKAFDLFKEIEQRSNPKISKKQLKTSFEELISVIS